jgi:hypothetical protein
LSISIEEKAFPFADHHNSFNPNWICLDVVEVDVMTPAVGETPEVAEPKTVVFGVLKLAWFGRLKNSARN